MVAAPMTAAAATRLVDLKAMAAWSAPIDPALLAASAGDEGNIHSAPTVTDT